MNREIESIAMRPLAKDLTRSLEEVRNITRDQALRDLNLYTDRMRDALRHFDSLFAEFELRYGVKKKKKKIQLLTTVSAQSTLKDLLG